jgi:tRNA G18 (ribose-2'-O)-methylase SpoU
MNEDTRNVTDELKGLHQDAIVERLDERGVETEIAVENTLRDFNMGTIVRSANAFGVRTVHVVGRRQWNKRGAMMTDKYLSVVYHPDVQSLKEYADEHARQVVAIDNVPGAIDIRTIEHRPRVILFFGQEGPGLSREALAVSNSVVMIEQRGSTRSLNVGVAAGIVMYEWTRSN